MSVPCYIGGINSWYNGFLCNIFSIYFQVFGSRVRVDAVSKVAELELAEKEKMKDKVDKIIKHGCNVFINRYAIL